MCRSCDFPAGTVADSTGPVPSRNPASSAAPSPSSPGAATVLRGGAVYTLDPRQPWASAVAVRGNRIIAVGTDDEATSAGGPDARLVDLDGRMVLPGFIEGHIHPLLGGFYTAGVDLQVPTRTDALAAIADYADANPDGPIRGFGWRMDMFGPDGPHRADIDAIVPDRPVLLFAIDGHSLWVNSATLDLAGITADTADPAPGFSFYARDAAGEPTGFVLEVAALLPVVHAVEPLTAELFARLLEQWAPRAAAAGITAVFDAGMPPAGADPDTLAVVYADLEAEGRLPFRVVFSHLIQGPPTEGAVAATLAGTLPEISMTV